MALTVAALVRAQPTTVAERQAAWEAPPPSCFGIPLRTAPLARARAQSTISSH